MYVFLSHPGAATTDVATIANESALVARQSQSQGGCTGDMILHEYVAALTPESTWHSWLFFQS